MDRAPNAWLTGVSWNWGPMMVELVEEVRGGAWKPSHVRGNMRTGHAVLDPFGKAVPEDLRQKVLDMKQQIVAGDKVVWEGPIVAQNGEAVVPANKRMTLEEIETMNWLVKGVIGSTN